MGGPCRREERLSDDNHLLAADKYSTPATAESGYRSQLTVPSTGKEDTTPLSQMNENNSLLENSRQLRDEARKVQKCEP